MGAMSTWMNPSSPELGNRCQPTRELRGLPHFFRWAHDVNANRFRAAPSRFSVRGKSPDTDFLHAHPSPPCSSVNAEMLDGGRRSTCCWISSMPGENGRRRGIACLSSHHSGQPARQSGARRRRHHASRAALRRNSDGLPEAASAALGIPPSNCEVRPQALDRLDQTQERTKDRQAVYAFLHHRQAIHRLGQFEDGAGGDVECDGRGRPARHTSSSSMRSRTWPPLRA